MDLKILDYPIICVMGKLGSGKTLTTTFIAYIFEKYCLEKGLDLTIFSNYELDLSLYKRVKAVDIMKLPKDLKDGIMILDEMHSEGGDSYNFLSPVAKKITTFVTQIRKRNIALIYTTQDYGFIMSRLRRLTYYFIQITPLKDYKTRITIRQKDGYMIINEFEIDLTDMFDYYDTNEFISQEDIETLELVEE